MKTSFALFGGQAISLCTQLLLPPLFLRFYGIETYGEWLTLTAATNYVATLNFGIQSFANNYVCIAHNRGDVEEVRTTQATAFLLLVGIAALIGSVAIVLFWLPLNDWLHIRLSAATVSITAYLLALQIALRMVLSFAAGSFLIVGVFHRGTQWYNAQALASLAVTVMLVPLGTSLPNIAGAQLGTTAFVTLLCLIDLLRFAPIAFPRLEYFRADKIRQIIKPSMFFALLFSSNFLVYQLPVIIMQRLLGSKDVVVFSLTRTIYSMSRQALTALSTALGPEIIELYANGSWDRLLRLYNSSERLIFALVPVATLGTFMATPVLMAVWLHRPELYQLNVCALMALISGTMGVKEHKYQFQTSSNHHSEMARFLFLTYIVMIALSFPMINSLGEAGFLSLWLSTELLQLLYIVRLNQRLFAAAAKLDTSLLRRLTVLLGTSMACCWCFLTINATRSLVEDAWLTLLSVVMIALASYSVFGVRELMTRLALRHR